MVLLAAGAFVFLDHFPSGKGKKQIGPYKYIKEARLYLKEEKYEKAVNLLHKAYEEAPESKGVRKNLINGYMLHAKDLDGKGQLDKAINNLEIAYEMDPDNVDLKHYLAYLYSRKAAEESSRGAYDRTSQCLQKATDMAKGSKKTRRNISTYLFNRAVEAFNKSENKTVILFLNTSYNLWRRADPLIFMGQYYYGESNFERALFYWNKARDLRPDDPEINKKIEMARKEVMLKKKMREIKTEHFDIRFYRDYQINADILQETLLPIYEQVSLDLDYYLPMSTPVFFYTGGDFREIFQKKGIIRAFYDGNIRMIFIADINDPMFAALIAHEYTHAVISILTDNRCPVWLHEGMATYEQGRYIPISIEPVKTALKGGKSLSIEELEKGFESADNIPALALGYTGSYAAVSFIIDEWGWPGLRDLLHRIKDGRHFTNAVDEEFYISIGEFENMFNEWMRKKLGIEEGA